MIKHHDQVDILKYKENQKQRWYRRHLTCPSMSKSSYTRLFMLSQVSKLIWFMMWILRNDSFFLPCTSRKSIMLIIHWEQIYPCYMFHRTQYHVSKTILIMVCSELKTITVSQVDIPKTAPWFLLIPCCRKTCGQSSTTLFQCLVLEETISSSVHMWQTSIKTSGL